jgi:GTP-binding protein
MRKPVVAVVGRPNVGKSTFFNKIAGVRISIVEDTPGVTRDRIYADCEWLNHKFTLIDTGGIEPSKDIIMTHMRAQAQIAIDTADVIIFMLDGKTTYTTGDEEIASMLMRSKKPIILAINKIDQFRIPEHFYDYYNLGLGEPMMISSVNQLNLGDLLDEVVKHFGDNIGADYDEDVIKVAIIGKPNAGKSSILNCILGEDRVIVSEIPGTTRDAIDTPFTYQGDDYVFIDTAGLRRKSKIEDNIERYSMMRTLSAIERSDVCLMVIDAESGVTEQDKRVAGYAHEAGKAIVLVVNKWDLLAKDNHTYSEYEKVMREELAYLRYAPVMFVSAVTKQRIFKVIEQAKLVATEAAKRIPTGTLNDVLNEAIMLNQPPTDKGKRLKIYYMTQTSIKPPTFVIFVNDEELAHFSYIRYIENTLRKNFDFTGTPLHFIIREKKENKL